ncbi:MAG: Glutamate N-acetyltransferase [Evtepia sp.]|jgi:glutamate N-acetyltransferase/amino-acid N-acetyltransferase|nr:Glutamate N-acetyltransferase [Evtepia sp.]
MNYISGGVAAPIGFTAAGVYCGVKQKPVPDGNDSPIVSEAPKKDLALIVSECDCVAAAVYTKNQVKAAPIYISQKHLASGHARGIVANSGNANACAPEGLQNAQRMANAAAEATGLSPEDFAVASTGVIGVTLNIEAIEAGIPLAAGALSKNGSHDASNAILTTDTVEKEIAVSIELGGKTVTIGAIAKGSGMIHPNMGTMLCFTTTDCVIDGNLLQKTLSQIVTKTFNRITVDGDSSTNDTCFVLANGMAGNAPLQEGTPDYDTFYEAIYTVFEYEAKKIAGDGEGASRLITCTVENAQTEEKAEQMAKSVVGSSLVKAAMFGADANWGRVLCAIGYSGASFDPEGIDVKFLSTGGQLSVCQNGAGLPFDEDLAKKILTESEVTILVTMHEGEASATCWGCDLTYDYVKINGDYRN